MPRKPTIASAGNVLIPAYLAILQKGYAVRREKVSIPAENELWYAEDPTRQFMAEDTLSLLGLVSLYETRGEDWRASDAQIDEFFAQHP